MTDTPKKIRLQASIPRPQFCDGYVWVDVSTPDRVLFVSEAMEVSFGTRLAACTNIAVFDGDAELAARVDKAAADYRLSLTQMESNINVADAQLMTSQLADVNGMNARLLAENNALKTELAALRAQLTPATPRLQPEDVPSEIDAKSMDDLRLPEVPKDKEQAGRRGRRG